MTLSGTATNLIRSLNQQAHKTRLAAGFTRHPLDTVALRINKQTREEFADALLTEALSDPSSLVVSYRAQHEALMEGFLRGLPLHDDPTVERGVVVGFCSWRGRGTVEDPAPTPAHPTMQWVTMYGRQRARVVTYPHTTDRGLNITFEMREVPFVPDLDMPPGQLRYACRWTLDVDRDGT